MQKDTINFILKLIGFSFLLCTVHYYIFIIFFSDLDLYLPIWAIYLFNAILVLVVYLMINHKASTDSSKIYNTFLVLTMVKMALAVVFLLPLFAGKSEHARVEVINFFLPYFIFLIFEIKMLSKFLKNQ